MARRRLDVRVAELGLAESRSRAQALVMADGDGRRRGRRQGGNVGWTAFPLVVLPVTRFLGREARWLDFIIVYNWSQVLQNAVYLAAVGLTLSGLAPGFLGGGLLDLAYIAIFAYECFIARVVLDIAWPAAGMIVLVDFVLGQLIFRAAQTLH